MVGLLLGAIVTLWLVSVITFAAITIKSPEDVARGALGRFVNERQLQAYVERKGLDEPIIERYALWLGDFVTGDWGVSPVTNRPVGDALGPRAANTLILAGLALLVSLPIALVAGAYVARRPRAAVDRGALVGSVVLAAMPEFVIALAVALVFGVELGWFPVDSSGWEFGGFDSKVRATVLPVVTLALAVVPYLLRISRATFREAYGMPYIQAALLRGVPRRSLIWRHALPNTAGPLVNAIAINLVWLLGGVIVVENVFGFPGLGQLLVESIETGDALTVQAIAMLTGALFIATTVLADLFVVALTPRYRGA